MVPGERGMATARAPSQNRTSRFTLTTRARLRSSENRSGIRESVSRFSLYTTNSSLPGLYSHRSRRLVLSELLLELYCTSALTNINGVIV